jgi:cytidylate kinase
MRHVAISGDIGSGKTSVATLLSQLTRFTLVSAGEILRRMAAQRGITALEANRMAERDATIDTEINRILVDLGQSETRLIYDSRIAWHLVPGVFKVHLVVDPEVAARRLLADRDSAVEAYKSVEEAKRAAAARYACERRRFHHDHGVDIAQQRNYHLVLDTSETSCAEIATKIRSIWLASDRMRLQVPPFPAAAREVLIHNQTEHLGVSLRLKHGAITDKLTLAQGFGSLLGLTQRGRYG